MAILLSRASNNSLYCMATKMIPDPLDPTKTIPAIDEEQLADWTLKKAAAEKARDEANKKPYVPIWGEFVRGIDIMLSPKAGTEGVMTMPESLQFYYKLTIIPFALSVILTFLLMPQFNASVSRVGLLENIVLIEALLYWVLMPFGALVISYPYHLLGKVLLFDGDYKNTFASFIYLLVPFAIFGWVLRLMGMMPGIFDVNGVIAVTIILILWSLWVFDAAIANLQDTGRFSPIALLVLFAVVIYAILAFTLPFTGI